MMIPLWRGESSRVAPISVYSEGFGGKNEGRSKLLIKLPQIPKSPRILLVPFSIVYKAPLTGLPVSDNTNLERFRVWVKLILIF